MSKQCTLFDLPESYLAKLDTMRLPQIAKEAARFRSDSPNHKGSSTDAIFDYVLIRRTGGIKSSSFYYFLGIYAREWQREKYARAYKRTEDRPIVGCRSRKERVRMGFALV